MNALPPEAEKLLLAIAPEEFVAARQRLVRELRAADRSDETATLARLRKPTVVVFAVNRAARDRPKAARSAAEAALHVKETQVGNQPEAFKRALDGSEASLDLLAEVAVAHVAPRGKAPSDAMRRRVRDLLRSAVADDAVGFSPFAGMVPASTQRPRRKSGPSRAEQQEAKRHEHERALREELAEAERHLQETVQSAHRAERERKSGERAVTSIRAKLERID